MSHANHDIHIESHSLFLFLTSTALGEAAVLLSLRQFPEHRTFNAKTRTELVTPIASPLFQTNSIGWFKIDSSRNRHPSLIRSKTHITCLFWVMTFHSGVYIRSCLRRGIMFDSPRLSQSLKNDLTHRGVNLQGRKEKKEKEKNWVLGATTGDPTYDKGHAEETWQAKADQPSRDPLNLLKHLPQNQNLSVLLFCAFHQLFWH